MKRNFILITAAVLVTILILFLFRKKADLETNFARITTPLNDPKSIASKQNDSELKNINNNILIFDRSNATVQILSNISLNNIDTAINFTIEKNLRDELIINIDSDSDNLYIFQPQTKKIIQINQQNVDDSLIYKTSYLYTRGSVINEDNYIVKESEDNVGLNEVFVVYRANEREVLDNVLPQLNDGGIGMDGFFASDGKGKNIFVTYYTNEVFVFENGAFKTSYSTIGGKRKSPEVVSKRKGLYSMKEIETATNENGEIYGDKFYILSNLEPKEQKDSGKYIDLYDLSNGEYVKSYFIPDYKGKKLSDFAISDNSLIALHKDEIILYMTK